MTTERPKPAHYNHSHCCWSCFEDATKATEGLPTWQRPQYRMIVCGHCGNKRCPSATNHELDCTGSNEPGQPGSRYTAGPSTIPQDAIDAGAAALRGPLPLLKFDGNDMKRVAEAVLSAAHELLSDDAHSEGYDAGYADGLNEGHHRGRAEAHDDNGVDVVALRAELAKVTDQRDHCLVLLDALYGPNAVTTTVAIDFTGETITTLLAEPWARQALNQLNE